MSPASLAFFSPFFSFSLPGNFDMDQYFSLYHFAPKYEKPRHCCFGTFSERNIFSGGFGVPDHSQRRPQVVQCILFTKQFLFLMYLVLTRVNQLLVKYIEIYLATSLQRVVQMIFWLHFLLFLVFVFVIEPFYLVYKLRNVLNSILQCKS